MSMRRRELVRSTEACMSPATDAVSQCGIERTNDFDKTRGIAATNSATLPSRNRLKPLCPCEPTTTKPACHAAAAL
jgi:hypothetical protein